MAELRKIDLRGRIPRIGPIDFLEAEVPFVPFALIRYSLKGIQQEYGLRLDLDKQVFIDHLDDVERENDLKSAAGKIVEYLSATLNDENTLHTMRKEWDDLLTPRKAFWETLGQYYVMKLKREEDYPGNIEELVDSAELPLGLPLSQHEHLRDYPRKYRPLLKGSNDLLYDFCRKVYPPKRPGLRLESFSEISSTISEESFRDFHEARGKLAKFWNRWVDDVCKGMISLDRIISSFGAHHRLLKILSYLEVCLIQWTQDEGVGKQWLFNLTKEWQDLQRKQRNH